MLYNVLNVCGHVYVRAMLYDMCLHSWCTVSWCGFTCSSPPGRSLLSGLGCWPQWSSSSVWGPRETLGAQSSFCRYIRWLSRGCSALRSAYRAWSQRQSYLSWTQNAAPSKRLSHPSPKLWSESQKPHGRPRSGGTGWWRPLPPILPPVCVRPWTARFSCNGGSVQSHTPSDTESCSCGPSSPNRVEGPCRRYFARLKCPVLWAGTMPGWKPGPLAGSTKHLGCRRAEGGHPTPAATSLVRPEESAIMGSGATWRNR